MDRKAMGRRMLAAGLLAAAAVGGSAGTAHAGFTRIADTDSFQLDATGWDFGGSGFDASLPTNGQPTNDGAVQWLLKDGVPAPHLTGYLHANKAKNTCAHVEIEYRNSAASVIHTTVGGEVCASNAKHKKWSVDLGTYSDPDIAKVTVKLYINNAATGGNTFAGERTSVFGAYLDPFKVTGSGWDLGNNTWNGRSPDGNATFLWLWDHGAEGHVTGTLHANKVSGDCARVQIQYLNELGGVIGHEETTVDTTGHNLCAAGNSHQTFSIGFGGTVPNNTGIVAANVNVQTLNSLGSYDTLATQKVDFSTIFATPIPTS
jgi:hypothetical protein